MLLWYYLRKRKGRCLVCKRENTLTLGMMLKPYSPLSKWAAVYFTHRRSVAILLLSRCFPNFFLHYPKPLIRKSFLPNAGKTLTAHKTYLTSEERSVKKIGSKHYVWCNVFILNISKHFSSHKNLVIIHHKYFISQVPANEYNVTVRLI
jgi:hypothetical protein